MLHLLSFIFQTDFLFCVVIGSLVSDSGLPFSSARHSRLVLCVWHLTCEFRYIAPFSILGGICHVKKCNVFENRKEKWTSKRTKRNEWIKCYEKSCSRNKFLRREKESGCDREKKSNQKRKESASDMSHTQKKVYQSLAVIYILLCV